MTEQIKSELYTEIKNILTYSEFDFSEETLQRFTLYFSDLLTKNKVMNLTAITEPAEVAELHLFDSLTLLDVLPDYFDRVFVK